MLKIFQVVGGNEGIGCDGLNITIKMIMSKNDNYHDSLSKKLVTDVTKIHQN